MRAKVNYGLPEFSHFLVDHLWREKIQLKSLMSQTSEVKEFGILESDHWQRMNSEFTKLVALQQVRPNSPCDREGGGGGAREIPDHRNNHISGVCWGGVGGSVSLPHASTGAPLETVLVGS